MTTPNWQHHSHKPKKTKGMCKGQLKARKQSLKALKNKFSRPDGRFSCMVY